MCSIAILEKKNNIFWKFNYLNDLLRSLFVTGSILYIIQQCQRTDEQIKATTYYIFIRSCDTLISPLQILFPTRGAKLSWPWQKPLFFTRNLTKALSVAAACHGRHLPLLLADWPNFYHVFLLLLKQSTQM
jgi:hypothetical protein